MRGSIICAMALNHSGFYLSKGTEGSSELWGGPFPRFDSLGLFFQRFVTLLCAPAFLFLMATSMVLFFHARVSVGWSSAKITKYFLTRGVVLILLQFLIENPAWNIGFPLSPFPVYFGVLYMLGVMMISCSLFLKLPSWAVFAVSAVSILLTPLIVPTPDLWNSPIPTFLRILAIPGATSRLNVLFPPLPWLGVAGLGVLFGRLLVRKGESSFALLLPVGMCLLGVFACLRLAGGHFGNLQMIPIQEWWSFFYTVKYPPSMAYLSLTLGVGSLILYGFNRLEYSPFTRWLRPLEILGGSALFFYIAHLFLYSFLGIVAGREDLSLLFQYLGWFIGLVMLVPMCVEYSEFKRAKPAESLWKMF